MLFRDPNSKTANSRRWAVGLTGLSSLVLILVATTAAAGWPQGSLPVVAGTAVNHDGNDEHPCAKKECDRADCSPEKCAQMAMGHVELPDLDFEAASGERVSLASLQGKVVVVEFWASWCKFCQREVKQMKELHESLQGTDFRMVGVSLSKTPEATRKFIAEHGVSWPQLHADEGWKSEAGKAFNVRGVPARYLIDRDGRVTMLPRADPEGLAKMVIEALDGQQAIASAAH